MNLKHFISIAMGGFLLASCAAEMEEIPAEELYLRDFIKKYGLIDPNQNWSMAHNCVITVKGAAGQNVKIYADIKGTRYIVADYDNVKDPAALTFDLPSGITNVIAKVAGRTYDVAVGGTVNAEAPASRTITSGTKESEGGVVLTYGETDKEKLISSKSIINFIQHVPEEENNIDNVLSNFSFVSKANEPVTIYPIYWNTGSSHVLGVYWLDENNNFVWNERDYIYQPGKILAEGETFYMVDDIWNDNSDIDFLPQPVFTHMQDLYWVRSGELKYCSEIYDTLEDYADATFSEIDLEQQESYNVISNSGGAFKTKGITFTFNKSGIRYGFYIKVQDGKTPLDGQDEGWCNVYNHILFSQSDRNEFYGKYLYYSYPEPDNQWKYDYYIIPAKDKFEGMKDEDIFYKGSFNNYVWGHPWDDNDNNGIDERFVSASYLTLDKTETWDGKTRSFFAFEDWRNSPDLNDLVFMFEEDQTFTIHDEDTGENKTVGNEDKPLTWTLAVEDLGETDDYDFNDLVLEITRVAGKTEATVKALAAGGIMPIKVMYDGKLLAETHVNQWFGEEDHTQMINTTTNDRSHNGGFTISVGADETMESIMGKFTIIVYDGETGVEAKEIRSFETEGVGKTPLMILVENDWEWPIERTDINDAYTGFKTWVSDPDHDWIATKQSDKVIARTKE